EEKSAALTDADKAALVALDQPGWWHNAETAAPLQDPLTGAAAWDFLRACKGRGMLVDAVARFHLGNGARLERINWLADTSDRAMAQAHGLMVNYLYDLNHIEKNHESYAEGRSVVASGSVQRLLRPPLELVPIAGKGSAYPPGPEAEASPLFKFCDLAVNSRFAGMIGFQDFPYTGTIAPRVT